MTARPSTAGGPFRARDFRRLFAAQTVSVLGDRIAPVAIAFAVLDLTGKASDLGVVLAAQTLPLALFLLPAGVWADRFPRQRLMVCADLVRAGAQCATAALLLAGHPPIWQLALLQAVYGSAEAFFHPALVGLLPQVLSRQHLQAGNALLGISNNAALVLGPPIAAGLLTVTSAGWVVAIDATTFVVSAMFVVGIGREQVRESAPPAAATSFLHDLRAGGAEVRRRSWVWAPLLAFTAYHALVLPAIFVLGPILSRQSYAGAATFASWVTGFGIGAIAGGLLALRYSPGRPMALGMCLLAVGALQPALLASGLPGLAIAALLTLTGASVAFWFTTWDTQLQSRIPGAALARVSSFDYFASVALMPVGYALVGPLAALSGVRTALLSLAAFGVAASLAPLAVRSVRELPRLGGDDSRGTRPLLDAGGDISA